jgi:subtilase family serine protease
MCWKRCSTSDLGRAAALAALGLLAAACGGSGTAAGRTQPGDPLPMLTKPAAATPLAPAPPPFNRCSANPAARCYQPRQLYRAYDLAPLYRSGNLGQGRTIAIIDSFGSPTIHSDLHAFDAAFHLPPARLQVVTPVGRPPPFRPTAARLGWAGEATLDVEWAHAVAPRARIILIESPVAETEGIHGLPQMMRAMELVGARTHVDVFSMSFAATEQTFRPGQIAGLRTALVAASARGSTLVGATGDDGAAGLRLDLHTLFPGPAVVWPASDPLVTAVGGTQIQLDAAGRRLRPDRTWNDASGATGGGISRVFPRPAYQRQVQPSRGDHRLIPDISLTGSILRGVVIRLGGSWRFAGGTSLATPLFAGIVALADHSAGRDLGSLNPRLYALAGRPGDGIVDVRRGQNSFRGVPGYRAVTGYDPATGLGTVDAARLVRSLAG